MCCSPPLLRTKRAARDVSCWHSISVLLKICGVCMYVYWSRFVSLQIRVAQDVRCPDFRCLGRGSMLLWRTIHVAEDPFRPKFCVAHNVRHSGSLSVSLKISIVQELCCRGSVSLKICVAQGVMLQKISVAQDLWHSCYAICAVLDPCCRGSMLLRGCVAHTHDGCRRGWRCSNSKSVSFKKSTTKDI